MNNINKNNLLIGNSSFCQCNWAIVSSSKCINKFFYEINAGYYSKVHWIVSNTRVIPYVCRISPAHFCAFLWIHRLLIVRDQNAVVEYYKLSRKKNNISKDIFKMIFLLKMNHKNIFFAVLKIVSEHFILTFENYSKKYQY